MLFALIARLRRSGLAVLLLGQLVACQHPHHEVEAKGKLLVSTPLRRPTELTKRYVAQLRAIQHIEIRALERGYLEGIFVDEGQAVEKGQRMFQIMPMLYKLEADRAKAELERAKVERDNTKALTRSNVVSPTELAMAKANVNKAEAELSIAKAHTGLAEVHAPFSGTMGRFQARLGSLIGEGDLLTTLSDTSTIWAYFNVAEAEYLQYQKDNADGHRAVKLQLANGQIYELAGKIETIEADFDNDTGTIAFRAAFPNPTKLLRHGETGEVVLATTVPDALLVPQKATFDVLDKTYVYVVDAKNVVHARQIEVKAELPQLYIVGAGLTEKDRILLDGLRKVRDGANIVADDKPATEVFAHLDVPAQ